MGLEKNRTHEAKKEGGKRGTTNNKGRLKAFSKASVSSGADWGGCSADLLQGVVVAITGLGGAVTIGMSRDQGAHSMTLLLDGSRETLWFNGNEDLDDKLREVLETLNSME